jgi:hypothetical protein
MGMTKALISGGLLLLAASVAACGAAPTPQLVASSPKLVSSGGTASSGVANGPVVVEAVYLTLEVSDPEGAAGEAARLACGYGGYENDRFAWQTDGGRAVAQEILVPLERSNDFLARLLQLGRKTQESSVRHPYGFYGPGNGWTEFSIQYMPREYLLEGGHSFARDIERAIWSFAAKAAAFFVQAAASLMIAGAIVIPSAMMAVGVVTTIRWLFRGK